MFEFNLKKQLSSNCMIDVSFGAREGEVTTLIGKSGAGKSSILNLIAGVVPLDEGYIRSEGIDYTDIPVYQRQFGYVQQQSHLFPHLSVYDNLTYSNNTEKLEEYLDIFELRPHLDKKIKLLSGGEAQRVSFVRTLMSQPRLLLLDEAFSALDRILKLKLRQYLKQLKVPILLITHDLEEAYEISDQIILIEKGKIIEKGETKSLFRQCRKIKTAVFLGIENLYPATFFENELRIEHFKCTGVRPTSIFKTVAIKATQISLVEEGHFAKIKTLTSKLERVRLELEVLGLSRPLIVELTWREYAPFKGREEVRFEINEFIYLEDSLC